MQAKQFLAFKDIASKQAKAATLLEKEVGDCKFSVSAVQKQAAEINALIQTHLERVSQLRDGAGNRLAQQGWFQLIPFTLLSLTLSTILYLYTFGQMIAMLIYRHPIKLALAGVVFGVLWRFARCLYSESEIQVPPHQ
eukprot:m.35129 g.35129  ORF g.35129 m.35129 type:complete len:138 (+) comp11105_c0_seq1:93-506(+)